MKMIPGILIQRIRIQPLAEGNRHRMVRRHMHGNVEPGTKHDASGKGFERQTGLTHG